MVTMQVVGLTIDSVSKAPLVILQDEQEQRILPLLVGTTEAMSISLSLNKTSLPRPLPHDLLVSIAVSLGGHIESVEVYEADDKSLQGDILIRQGEQWHKIDCRPSDAITLALRLDVPIKVHPQVLQAATVIEKDGQVHFRVLNTSDNATDMLRKTASAQKQTQKTEENMGDKKLKKLLQDMAPLCQRPM